MKLEFLDRFSKIIQT